MPSQRRERRLTSELGFRKHLGGKWAGRDVDAPSRTSKSHAHDGEGWVADGSSGGRDKHLRQQQPRSTEIAVSSAEGGFMTARDTARNMYTARGSETDDYLSAVEPYPTKTARDMFTARGFETDDYMSAVDSTPRRKDDDLDYLNGAPAYGRPSNQFSVRDALMPGSGTGALGLHGTGRSHDTRAEWRMEGSPACVERKQDCGNFRDQVRPGKRTSAATASNLGKFSEHFGGERQRQQLIKPKVGGRIIHNTSDGGGGDIDEQQRSGHSRQSIVEDIFSYARHNRVEDLERMMDQGVPVDVRDSHGNTVLIVACQNGHKRALKAALRRGADPNAINSRGNTGLHFCHAFGYGGTLGQYLISKGADASMRNNSGLVCYGGIGR